MMAPEIIAAHDLLASFRIGDLVTVTFDGKDHDMIVSRELRRSDGAYGSYESSQITVTYGPGRYSREVKAEQLAGRWVGAGTFAIARRES